MSRAGMDDQAQAEAPEGIAIVGMACRFPGARSVDAFWENLCHGVESISILSEDDLARAGVPPSEYRRDGYVKAAALLDGLELFDASFFDIPPREAALMDPQHRLLLECTYETLECAGYLGSGSHVGVFAGSYLNTYAYANVFAGGGLGGVTPLQLVAALDKDYLVTRISYKLDLTGPSIGVQTACSTALVAVHLACQSLLTYDCDLALAGAVSAKVPQDRGYTFTMGGILSPDGHCRPFDAAAGGTIFGNGMGMVALKRLEDALADGDTIHAVIRGSAVNNDGRTKIGYTAPSVRGQAEVVAMAHACASVAPETITYIETHGTGTALGDPVEIAALKEAFEAATSRRGFCALGSVKSNFGHLDVAAGIAGLIKTTLALEHRQIPPSLHFERPNPQIDFSGSPFFVNSRISEWRSEGPRRAGVSSFGVGGTNAHVILEEAPPQAPSGPSRPWQLLILSARTPAALDRVAEDLARHLEKHPAASLADVAFTLEVGRRAYDHRRLLCCSDTADAAAVLCGQYPDRLFTAIRGRGDRPLAFLFPGQGTQYAGMGRQLYASEPVFREQIDRCAQLLAPRLGLDLRAVLHPAGEDESASLRLFQTSLAQPALFVVEYALARLLISWGLEPQSLAGHSIGEYVAACLAGTFSLPAALGLVAVRGRLMQALPPGAMLSVPLAESEVSPLLDAELSLAAVNGPARCVVAGPEEAVERLARELKRQAVSCRRLRTSHAFHSSMMEPIVETFAGEVAQAGAAAPRTPFLSCVTGGWIEASEAADPLYWARQLRQPVRFAAALEELLGEPDRVLLEVGPGHTLSTLARRHSRCTPERVVLNSLPAASEDGPDLPFLLTAVGRLWLTGVEPDWPAFHQGESRRRIPLPTYPFERQRHWIEPVSPVARQHRAGPKAEVGDWFQLPSWKLTLAPGPGEPEAEQPAAWLLFCDEVGLGTALTERLRRAGHRVLTVPASEACTADPESLPSYEALFAELAAAGGVPENVVHLLGVTGRAATAEEVDPSGWRAFSSLVALGGALGRRGPGGGEGSARITVVADGIWRVAADDRPRPEKALLLGPAQVLPWEAPGLSCRILDVQLGPAGHLDDLAEQLAAELVSGRPEEQVAYRADQRWVQTFEPVHLKEQAAPPRRLRTNGVYLITGGFGGVGLELAALLARTVRARLVLVSRSELPPEGTLRRLEELESLGAEVLVLRADVTDEGQMREVVARTLARFGALHGAIHGAGLPGGELMALATPRSLRAVLAPKVQGTRVLAAAVAALPLDFLVLLSSTFSLVGGAGQAAYCAANAFLDAFAQARTREAPPTLSINWDLWRGIGMAAHRAPEDGTGEETGHPLLGRHIRISEEESVYRAELSPERSWVLAEHTVLGVPVLPGVAYLEMARAAFEHRTSRRGAVLRDVAFLEPLAIPRGERREVRTVLRRAIDGFSFTVEARSAEGSGDGWRQHASGSLGAAAAAPRTEPGALPDPSAAPATGVGKTVLPTGFVEWGAHWQEIREHWLRDDLAFFERSGETGPFALYPPLLDRATSLGLLAPDGGILLPRGYERLTCYGPLPSRVYVRVERDEASALLRRDLVILDEAGWVLAEVEGFTLRRIDAAALDRHAAAFAAPDTSDGGEGSRGMPARDAVDAFQRILGQVTASQIAVSPWDLGTLRTQRHSGRPEGLTARSAAAPIRRGGLERPELQTSYVSPGSEVENLLVELFQEVLGFARIGVHDSFFELGGDSVLALQLAGRLRQVGFELSPRQLFMNPTAARLGTLLGPASADVGAEVPQLPDQLAFLAQGLTVPHRLVRSVLLRTREALEPAPLREALEELAGHHEALRLRFEAKGTVLAARAGALPLFQVDLADVEPAEQERAAELAMDRLTDRLDLAAGPLAMAVLFNVGPQGASRLGIAVHQLAADLSSWPVLLTDLLDLYRQAKAGGPMLLERRSAKLSRWAERLAEEARSPGRRQELPFWINEARPADLSLLGAAREPGDRPALPLHRGAVRSFDVWLDPATTELLTSEVAGSFGCELEEIVLAALALALGAEAGSLRIEVADSRRREVLQGVDIARTVGPLTRIHPLRIDLAGGEGSQALLEKVKGALRRIPDGGIGYGVLRHLAGGEAAEALGAQPEAEILFSLLDSFELAADPLVEDARELAGASIWGGHVLDIRCELRGGRLCLLWSHSTEGSLGSVVEALARRVLEVLRELVERRPDPEERRYVPVDFPQADLDQEELDELIAELSGGTES